MNEAKIGISNIITIDNVTASSSATNFPARMLSNPLTFERWKATALPATIDIDAGSIVDVDYVAAAAHTFERDRVVLTLQKSTDGITYTDIGDISPGSTKPIMANFSTISSRYWRLLIEGDTPPSIGVFYLGESLTVERGIYGGHTPINMAHKTKRITNKTDAGQYAGSSVIKQGVQTSYQWRHLGSDWYRSTMDPFILAARSTPFFIAWRPDEYPQEIGFVWAPNDAVPVNMGIKDLMEVQMNVQGFSDE